MLVSNRGRDAEDLLLRYLEYVRERYLKGEIGPITSEQLENERGFSFEQSRFLSKLLNYLKMIYCYYFSILIIISLFNLISVL